MTTVAESMTIDAERVSVDTSLGEAARRSERYQRALLDNFPFLVWLKDTQSRFLAVNQPMADAWELPSVEALLGKTDLDFSPHDLAVHYMADDAEVMARGEKKYVVEQVVDHGIRQWFETYKAPVYSDDGSLLGTVGFARDISGEKREEEAIIIRNAAQTGLLRGEPLKGVLELIALSVETEMPGWICAILQADALGKNLLLTAAPSATELWCKAIGSLPIEEGAGCSGTAAFRRQNMVVEDAATHPFTEKYREMAHQVGIAAACSIPIITPNGDLLGIFTAYQRQVGAPDDRQAAVLVRASQLVALILVQQRNAQRLSDTLDTFRALFNSVSEALFVQAAEGVFLDINLAAAQMFGFAPEQLIGQSHERLAAEGLNDLPAIQAAILAALDGAARRFEFWGKNAEGLVFPCEVNLQASHYFGQRVVIASVQDISERQLNEQRLRIEHDLAHALSSGMSREEVHATLLDIALRFPEFDCGGLYVHLNDGRLKLVAHRGLSDQFVTHVTMFANDSPQARLVRAGEVVCSCTQSGDCCTDFGLIHAPHLQEEGLLSLAVLPVLLGGVPVASLNLASRKAHKVTRATFNTLQGLRQHFAQTLLRFDVQEEALRLQRNLSGLFDTLQDYLFILDAAGRIQHYNHAVTEGLGYSESELIGQAVVAVHPRESHEMVRRVVAEMLAGERKTCLSPLLRRDGRQVMVETRVVAGYWNGEPALFGLSRDISERLLAAERQKLAASVFENAHEGIMITDPVGRIVEVNPTFTELTGYSRSEAIGHTTDLLKSGHHEAAFYAGMWQTIKQQGYWRGEVWNRKKSGEIFVELLTISTVRDSNDVISHFVGIFSDITVLKEHQQRLEHLAHFDALTQLPNRMLLADRLHLAMAQSERSNKTLAIAYLDLDGFKTVNDEFGHATGDRLLVEVAQRLRQCMRAGDTAARLGGDEFVLLFSALDDIQECDRAVSRVLASLAQPFHIKPGQEIQISASVGVTLYPHDGADADTLLRHADQAMYAAKQGGRNRFHLFDPESDRRARVWREELGQVRAALLNQEFVLYYQPKVNMREGRVIGAEALIRWQHPVRGLLLPGQFLPVIEGSDLNIALGEWVLQEALRQMGEWHAAGLPLAVSVNISGEHLLSHGFVDRLTVLLAVNPTVLPELLELEILETAALEDIAQAAEVFSACRQLGVSFALDDFGTGYSSLTYFRRLPADMLKIDQSFVRDMLDDPDDLAIVEGIIGLTQAFHRKVIAEGVETPEHGMMLLQLGCDLAQGFGIAHPMPARQLPEWVAGFIPNQLWSSVAAFNWPREDLPMLVAEGDHQRWVSGLEVFLADPQGDPAFLVQEAQHCRFGCWYYGAAHTRYGHFDSYRDLEPIHIRLHELGNKLIALAHSGDVTQISRLREELDVTSADLSRTIQVLQVEVLMNS